MTDKAQRVANFHRETITNLMELVGAAGLDGIEELKPSDINHRVQGTEVKNYAELYPELESGCLLNEATIPEEWRVNWGLAQAETW